MKISEVLERLYFLDFYKMIPEEKVVRSISGAILSTITLALVILIIIIEIRNYDNSRVISDIIPNSGDILNTEDSLELYFNIVFFHVPCSVLEISSSNKLQDKMLKKKLVLTRISYEGEKLGYYIDNHQESNVEIHNILEQYAAREGCILEMTSLKPSVKGNFAFTLKFLSSSDIMSDLLPSIYEHLNFSHTIKEFEIKNSNSIYILKEIQKYFKEKINKKNFDSWNKPGVLTYQNLTNETTYTFQDSMSVIFFLQISHEKYFFETKDFPPVTYKRYKFYKNIRKEKYPAISFIYNVSPFHIEYKLLKESISNLILKVFSTFVGLLVVSEIIESICYEIYTFITARRKFLSISNSSI